MNKFKHAALALATVGLLLSAQVHAGEAQAESLQALPVAAFSQTDINAMFEQVGQPMQLAALSQQEMMETEGALLPLVGVIGKVGFRLALHGPHHPFRWIGRQPHLQLNVWRDGVKGSGRVIFRIPTRFR